MDALYHQTNQLAEFTQTRFAALERALGQDAVALEAEIQRNIDTISRYMSVAQSSLPPTILNQEGFQLSSDFK
jgi:hypothetical protein